MERNDKIKENNYNKISYYFSFIKENNNKNIKSFLYELKNLKKRYINFYISFYFELLI